MIWDLIFLCTKPNPTLTIVLLMADIYREHCENGEISRDDIQVAIAKAIELRALHAALMAGGSPANSGFPSASPVSHHARNLTAQDYPVFAPSYNDEPLPGYQQIPISLRDYAGVTDGTYTAGTLVSDYKMANPSSRIPSRSGTIDFEAHICTKEEQKYIAPDRAGYSSSRQNSLDDIRSISSCNKCRPAIISIEPDGPVKNVRRSNAAVSLSDTHLSLHSKPRKKHTAFSWLFSKLRKKNKNEYSRTGGVSQVLSDSGIVSVETLKREVVEAKESRDSALNEVVEMKSWLGELKEKLEYLETYCEELKKALRQNGHIGEPPRIEKSIENEQVMAEGFLQIVFEARLAVEQLCKTLICHVEENDVALVDNLNSMLRPYKLSLNSKYSKAVLYHLEAFISQSLYKDFENCVFRENGPRKLLDPRKDREARFESFISLRNLSWNEVLGKGTKCYSEEFRKFCDEKMSGIVTALGCTRPWPEQLLQSFFVAAKCIWLLHLLAFSFRQPLGILRVDENVVFDPDYMEDIFADRQRSESSGRVKIMVMPGFYVVDSVLKCKVLCRYKHVS
ncbi:hypothetical protein OROGR_002732 [Orobanche gracilis]